MAAAKSKRIYPEGKLPLLDLEGSTVDCGERLGWTWREAIQLAASRMSHNTRPWWQERRFAKLIDRYAPHLPALFTAMAKGAGVPPTRVEDPAPKVEKSACTSFIIQPSATLEGVGITGQTKDTPADRIYRYVVLRLKFTDAPPALTLTYPGQVFGHGFVRGRCAIFRNSMFAGDLGGPLPFMAWGILAIHCTAAEDVVALTRDYGSNSGLHCSIADEQGGALGIEAGRPASAC
jgi:hypothetical protein